MDKGALRDGSLKGGILIVCTRVVNEGAIIGAEKAAAVELCGKTHIDSVTVNMNLIVLATHQVLNSLPVIAKGTPIPCNFPVPVNVVALFE